LRRNTGVLWWRILAWETDEQLHERTIEELGVTVGAFDDLAEEGCGSPIMRRMAHGLLVFRFTWGWVEESDCQV
jgi:hypothetical protein